MPDKLPVETQKIIYDFFMDFDQTKEGKGTNWEQRIEAYIQFSNKIKPYLEKPFLPYFLDV